MEDDKDDDLLPHICVPSPLRTATTIKMVNRSISTAANNTNTTTSSQYYYDILNYSDTVEHTSQYKEPFVRYNKKDGTVVDCLELELNNTTKNVATINHNDQEVTIELVVDGKKNNNEEATLPTSPKSVSFQTTVNCRSLETKLGRLYVVPIMDDTVLGCCCCCCFGGSGGGNSGADDDNDGGGERSASKFNIWLQEPISKEEQQQRIQQQQQRLQQGKHPGITPKQRRPRAHTTTLIAECYQSSKTSSVQMEFYDNNNSSSNSNSTSSTTHNNQQTQEGTMKLLSLLLMIAYVDSSK